MPRLNIPWGFHLDMLLALPCMILFTRMIA